jgi:hypothetical protein
MKLLFVINSTKKNMNIEYWMWFTRIFNVNVNRKKSWHSTTHRHQSIRLKIHQLISSLIISIKKNTITRLYLLTSVIYLTSVGLIRHQWSDWKLWKQSVRCIKAGWIIFQFNCCFIHQIASNATHSTCKLSIQKFFCIIFVGEFSIFIEGNFRVIQHTLALVTTRETSSGMMWKWNVNLTSRCASSITDTHRLLQRVVFVPFIHIKIARSPL